ncbi:MAG: bifunctional DNA-formamidopyrimidine glycosylase/DNA-(apurinic or apyrimidinic site) lyase [Anaerolineae bacterium]
MPELPEVETVARCLRRHLLGDTVTKAHVLLERTIASPDAKAFSKRIQGRRFASFGRRGKYLLVGLEPGGWLVVHFGMSGRLRIIDAGDSPAKHTRLLLELASGRDVLLDDQRTFGHVWLVDDPETVTEGLGPEPLSEQWTLERLAGDLQARRRMIKPLLLDQSFVAGLGNIYVDEALHRARLHPAVPADRLSGEDVARLYGAIRSVLREAIEHEGTTLRDFRVPDGDAGRHQLALRVYGREGEPCESCGSAIIKIRLAQRGTHYCPVCQPPPAP